MPRRRNEQIRIAYVATVDSTVRFLLLNCLRYLQCQGYQVSAVCTPGRWAREIRARGVRLLPVGMSRRVAPLADARALLRLTSLFRQEHPHLVHTHTPKANLLGRLAARLAGVPLVCGTEHGFYFHNRAGMQRRFHATWARIGAACSDRVFLVNQEDAATARREAIVPAAKLRCLEGGTGVDMERFRPRPSLRMDHRRDLGLNALTPVVGIVARLVDEKGHREFLHMAAKVTALMPQAHFLILGDGDPKMQQEYEALAGQLGLSQSAHFLGRRLDMPSWYAAMDLVVLPSHREGMSTVLMETAAMGRPAVATDIRGCHDVVVDGETGLLVPPADVTALTAAVLRLLQDEKLTRTMGAAARRRAEEHFDERKVFQQIEAEYRVLFASKGLRPYNRDGALRTDAQQS